MSRLSYVGLVMLGILLFDRALVLADRRAANPSTTAQSDAERGRAVFNGKGVCHYCRGIDGNKDQRPQLAADTAALISQLNPQSTDLRNPNVLRLKTNKERIRAIREGHPGTGMFPDQTMKDSEVADLMAYLALLRSEGARGKVHQSR